MKIIKRIFKYSFILIVVAVAFRAWLYRHLVTYSTKSVRSPIQAETKLINFIDSITKNKSENEIEHIITLGLSITSNQLNFTFKNSPIDPNVLISTKLTHCVGYASFFATICNYLLKKHHLKNKWKVTHREGLLKVFGLKIHDYLDSPFYNSHDFVTIENKETGVVFAVDPSLNDYLFIDFITYTK